MCRFFESIKLLDGQFFHLDLHTERLNKTRQFHFGDCNFIDLTKKLQVPPRFSQGLYKVKIEFEKEVESISFDIYEIQKHRTLILQENNDVEYSYKSVNRSELTNFIGADDVIFVKNGRLTDTSYANVCFYKSGQWFTPKSYLLNGIKRQTLLRENAIKEIEIFEEDLENFEKIAFINAMRDFELVYNFKINENVLELSL